MGWKTLARLIGYCNGKILMIIIYRHLSSSLAGSICFSLKQYPKRPQTGDGPTFERCLFLDIWGLQTIAKLVNITR